MIVFILNARSLYIFMQYEYSCIYECSMSNYIYVECEYVICI